jgi:hypothetical protein
MCFLHVARPEDYMPVLLACAHCVPGYCSGLPYTLNIPPMDLLS